MSWSGLASNQMVTFTNAQSSGAALKSGQSHVNSDQCMTRLDIVTKYNVNINILLCADNQLAPKSLWEAVMYPFEMQRFGYLTSAEACSGINPDYTYYATTPTLSIGTQLYLYNNLNQTVSFTHIFYHRDWSGNIIKTDLNGVVIELSNCLTYTYYGNYYYDDPCSGFTPVYRGSNGRWYRSGDGINFTDVTGGFGTTYAYFNESFFQYAYNLWAFSESFLDPQYSGETLSGCAPF
jgi:hypothetical protein